MRTRTTVTDRIGKAIREAYPLPEPLATIAQLATFDLWHGPVPASDPDAGDDWRDWPGFVKATEMLRDWADDNLPRILWYDDDARILLHTEPETEDENGEPYYLEETYAISARDILAARFPNKLSEYL